VTVPLIELAEVRRAFNDGDTRREVLRGISLSVDAGEMVALVGSSGCGKTTLLNVIGCLDDDYQGEAKLLGQSLSALDDDQRTRLRNERIGFVFQSFHLLEHLTVIQNVQVPLWLSQVRLDVDEEKRRAREALEIVGLADRAEGSVRPLSGGERQRVAIARALVNRPTLLLADEPTGNLDRETGRAIYGIFERVKRTEDRPCAVVVVTHDVELAKNVDRTITLAEGRIV
jgi:ABC-type lipoprotein export system ATPase subunit